MTSKRSIFARTTKVVSILIVVLFLTANLQVADAHWKVKTRSRCRWWSKRFKAWAYTRCWWMWPFWNCIKKAKSCDNAVTGTCSVTCFTGSASCSSFNGWGGWGAFCSATGDARFGSTGARDSDADAESLTDVGGNVEFSDQSVTVSMGGGFLKANANDSSLGFLDVVVWDADDEYDEALTRDKIVQAGSVRVQEGKVTTTGFFTAEDFDVSTETFRNKDGTVTNLSVVAFKQLKKVVAIKKKENIVVEISGDGNFRVRNQCLALLDGMVHELGLNDSLRTTLQGADHLMDDHDATGAVEQLSTFQTDVTALMEKGTIGKSEGSALLDEAENCSAVFLSTLAVTILNIEDGDEMESYSDTNHPPIPITNSVSADRVEKEDLALAPFGPFLTGTITNIPEGVRSIDIDVTINGSSVEEFGYGIAPTTEGDGFGFVILTTSDMLVDGDNTIGLSISADGSISQLELGVVLLGLK